MSWLLLILIVSMHGSTMKNHHSLSEVPEFTLKWSCCSTSEKNWRQNPSRILSEEGAVRHEVLRKVTSVSHMVLEDSAS